MKGSQTVILNKSDCMPHVETMLNSGLYAILDNVPSANHLVEIKYNVKNFVRFSGLMKRMVIPSLANSAYSMLYLKFINPHLLFVRLFLKQD